MFGKYGRDRSVISVDTLDEFLLGRDFGPVEVKNIRRSISRKLTVDMFSGKTEALTDRELYYQDCVQQYFDMVKEGRSATQVCVRR